MLSLFRKKTATTQNEPEEKSSSWFKRLSTQLGKTRHKLTDQMANLFLGKKQIDAELLEELETILLSADIGVHTTQNIMKNLSNRIERKQFNDSEALYDALKLELVEILRQREMPMDIESNRPFVILLVGINGAGKTTTIGKLAHYFQQKNKTVMLAAGDTFRAAAVEQLQTWGERNKIPVIAQKTGADSASVLFDGIQAAKSRQIDILLADTAGRLHNKSNLMEELKKIKRVLQKAENSAPHEVMLILDASIGQNALNQVKEFHEAVGVTSLVLTKLDGTAKGGIVFAIAEQFNIPIQFIGVGEKIDDLQTFNADAFVEALFFNE